MAANEAALRKEIVKNLPSERDAGFWKELFSCEDTNRVIEVKNVHNDTILRAR